MLDLGHDFTHFPLALPPCVQLAQLVLAKEPHHLVEQPSRGALHSTSSYRRYVADDVRLQPGATHLLQQTQALLPLLALLERADRRVVADIRSFLGPQG